MVDTSVSIAGLRFKNPVIAASGTFGYGVEYEGLVDAAALGGIVSKGLTLRPRPGNKGLRLWETASGLLNSIGLENPGIEHFIAHELPRMKNIGKDCADGPPVIIANLSGASLEEYEAGAGLLNASAVDAIELNISCPNVRAGGMAFGLEPGPASEVCGAVRSAAPDKPLIVKLSPNAPYINAVAQACVSAGADALSLVNTFKGMAFDIDKRKPVFDNISAGLSGPCIKPIALRMVWELCEELKRLGLAIPVIGLGGIATASDALEFLLAGAVAVQVGSATFAHPSAMIEIIKGIEAYGGCYVD
jgi:dihydroorotate dehydrogenase (NAD+) catalytic subunit